MKRLVSFVLVAAMLLTSVSAFAAPEATKHDVQNNVYVEGSVGKFVAGEKLMLTLTKGEEVVYVGEYSDVVKANGSYAIKFKHSGDLTGAEINVKYAGEDVTKNAVEATSTPQILEAAVVVTDSKDRTFDMEVDTTMPEYTFDKEYSYGSTKYDTKEHTYKEDFEIAERSGLKAVVDIKNKFAYEPEFTLMVAAYDVNGKLLDCVVETKQAQYAENGEIISAETAEIDMPEGTASAKAFCWSAGSSLIPYGKEANGELEKITIFCVGDSTGDTWPRKWYPQAGWGTYLQDYFNEEYATVYYDANGETFCTSGAWAQSIMNNPDDARHPDNAPGKGFYGQGNWQKMEKIWKPGDYVIVCLGINDAAEGDKDGKYTDLEWFAMAYQDMADRAKAAGVNLIFISATPSAAGQGTRADFNAVAKSLAEENGLVYLDHASKMQEVYAQSPDTVAQDYYLHRETFLKSEAEGGFGLTQEEIDSHGNEAINPAKGSGTDTTHISIKGANLACQKIVECLAESNSPLRFYVK